MQFWVREFRTQFLHKKCLIQWGESKLIYAVTESCHETFCFWQTEKATIFNFPQYAHRYLIHMNVVKLEYNTFLIRTIIKNEICITTFKKKPVDVTEKNPLTMLPIYSCNLCTEALVESPVARKQQNVVNTKYWSVQGAEIILSNVKQLISGYTFKNNSLNDFNSFRLRVKMISLPSSR